MRSPIGWRLIWRRSSGQRKKTMKLRQSHSERTVSVHEHQSVAARVLSIGVAAAEKASPLKGDPGGCRIPLSTLGAWRLTGWRLDIRCHELAARTYSGQGREARPRSV